MKITKFNFIYIFIYLFLISFNTLAGDTNDIIMEADYILSCQFLDSSSEAYGAINNESGDPTWVVPGENAIAIMGLEKASRILEDDKYLQKANLAADYLVRVQDQTDGAWFSKYNYITPYNDGKGLRHTAEVMIAFDKLGYNPERYDSMKKASQFILDCQDQVNKQGEDDGLVGGGKKSNGDYHTWRWSSDNSFAYQALKASAEWAKKHDDNDFAGKLETASQDILDGIQTHLFNGTDHWHRVIDQNDDPLSSEVKDPEGNPENRSDWIGYSPLMLDLPVSQYVDPSLVGDWISNTLKRKDSNDGSLVWDDTLYSSRQSPGYSFQAMLVWLDLNQSFEADLALDWAEEHSGLWQTAYDLNNIKGGWIDWIDNGAMPPVWDRFIDTSAYYIMTHGTDSIERGYDFNPEVPEPSTLILFFLGIVSLFRFNKKNILTRLTE